MVGHRSSPLPKELHNSIVQDGPSCDDATYGQVSRHQELGARSLSAAYPTSPRLDASILIPPHFQQKGHIYRRKD